MGIQSAHADSLIYRALVDTAFLPMNTCTPDDITQLLIESDAISADDEVLTDAPLKQMGVQSLDKFNLFLLVEEKFGVQVPDEEFDNLDTITTIATYVTEKAATS